MSYTTNHPNILESGAASVPEKLISMTEVDLSHHLSRVGAALEGSPVKDLMKYASNPGGAFPYLRTLVILKFWTGSIMVAGGFPSPVLFPFENLSAQILLPDSFFPSRSFPPSSGAFGWISRLFGSTNPSAPATRLMTIPKYLPDATDRPEGIQLSAALQYGTAAGLPALHKFVTEFTKTVYKPLNSKMECLLHAGSTFGWANCLQTLCNPGEFLITEDWAYVSALIACQPYRVQPVGVAMDDQGMKADALENLLVNWDPVARGGPR